MTAAAEALRVSQPTVSAQIRKLERNLGHELFDRGGRTLSLTPEGRMVLEYAEEIFRLGDELEGTVKGLFRGRPTRFMAGVSATIPNLVAFHLLAPAFGLEEPVRLVVREKRTDRLLADLATHELDVVLADMRIPAHVSVRAFEHELGSSTVDILGPPLLVDRLREGFPRSLEGQPFLLPTEGYTLRRSLDDWFVRSGIRPQVIAEVEDNDLINVLAEGGAGLFAAPSLIVGDIRVRYAVDVAGRAAGVREYFYAITPERRIGHPALVAIVRAARRELREGRAAPPEMGWATSG